MDTSHAGSDPWIAARVKAELMTENAIPGSGDIRVSCVDGKVTLSSDAPVPEAMKQKAISIAGSIKGVKGISAEELLERGGETEHGRFGVDNLLSRE